MILSNSGPIFELPTAISCIYLLCCRSLVSLLRKRSGQVRLQRGGMPPKPRQERGSGGSRVEGRGFSGQLRVATKISVQRGGSVGVSGRSKPVPHTPLPPRTTIKSSLDSGAISNCPRSAFSMSEATRQYTGMSTWSDVMYSIPSCTPSTHYASRLPLKGPLPA